MIRSSWFKPYIEKIAKEIFESSERFKIETGSKSGLDDKQYGVDRVKGRTDLQSTLTKSRENADLQPLHKDRKIRNKPRDMWFPIKMTRSQKSLSHMEDKRLTRASIRGE